MSLIALRYIIVDGQPCGKIDHIITYKEKIAFFKATKTNQRRTYVIILYQFFFFFFCVLWSQIIFHSFSETTEPVHLRIWFFQGFSLKSGHIMVTMAENRCLPKQNWIQCNHDEISYAICYSFFTEALLRELEERVGGSEPNIFLYSFRMLHRISAHLLILGRFFLWGAKHCNASSRIFSKAKLFAGDLSSLGSKTKIASPSENFFMAWANTTLYQSIYSRST